MTEEKNKRLIAETRKIVKEIAERGGIIFIDCLIEKLMTRGLGISRREIEDNVGSVLSSLSKKSYETRKIMISVVVIDRKTKLPWKGFFVRARKLKHPRAPLANLSKERAKKRNNEFFEYELKRVHFAYGARRTNR